MSSQKYDKDRTVQHKKRKTTLPKIVSPAMMGTCEEDYRNKKYDEEKEVECPDDTSTVDMEEGVKYRKDDSNEKHYGGNLQNALMALPLMLLRKL